MTETDNAIIARIEQRLNEALRAVEVDAKSWYERHVTAIVGVLTFLLGLAAMRIFHR